MKPLRDPRALDEEAAAAREQAQALHRAAVDAVGRENAGWGARRDAAQREALAARAHADAATKQANELYSESNRHAELAGQYNAHGAQLNATNPVEAEDWFENANGIVRLAETMATRAEAARDAAQPLITKAEELERQLQQIDNESVPPHLAKLEKAADRLDDKARLLSEAAQKQRDAATEQAAGDPGAASGSTNWARYALEQADAIEPDYSALDPQLLRDAGIPLSQIPGSELMEPVAEVSAAVPADDDVTGAPAYADAETESGVYDDPSELGSDADASATGGFEPAGFTNDGADAFVDDGTNALTTSYAYEPEAAMSENTFDTGTYDDMDDASTYEPSIEV